jgi:hypothetical protein
MVRDKLYYLVYQRHIGGKSVTYLPVGIVVGIHGTESLILSYPKKQRKMIGFFATHRTELKDEEIKHYTKNKILAKFSQNIKFG